MGSAVNGFEDKPRMVEKRKKKGRYKDGNNRERVVRAPRASSDTMYKWSMWRMYLNEDMSHALSHAYNKTAARASEKMANKRAPKAGKHSPTDNRAVTVSSIGAVYIRHRDAMKYGRSMKEMSARSLGSEEMERILPDNVYLVYGLPRISLAKHLPNGVRELYASVEKDRHDTGVGQATEEKENFDTDKCINKLFDFVADEMKDENAESVERKDKNSAITYQTPIVAVTSPSGRDLDNDVSAHTLEPPKDEADTGGTTSPLVSKSRLFWEKLANKKPEIVKPEQAETKENASQSGGISSDVLLKQQKLLKKSKPESRSSRDLWRTLAQRKHEILQLRDWDNDPGEPRKPKLKKQESKTGQLWSLIFSKKKELVQMKRNKTENVQQDKNVSDKKLKRPDTHEKKEILAPVNFQDNFQKELEARLKKFRVRAEQDTETTAM